ncbi:Protein of unknown function [Bacillus wiedmannii]|nr:Protein of unknown function [Bacillus wiedmannii]
MHRLKRVSTKGALKMFAKLNDYFGLE